MIISMFFCKQCEDFKLCGGGCFARWYGSGVKEAYLSECVLKQVSIKQIKIQKMLDHMTGIQSKMIMKENKNILRGD